MQQYDWLLCETWNMQTPAEENLKGGTEEALQYATCFSQHLLFEPQNLN